MTSPSRILTAAEPWTEYQLDDGTLLRFRFAACNFRKTGKTTEQGDQEYSFTHHIQCETHAPKAVDRVRLIYAGPEKDVSGAEAVKALMADNGMSVLKDAKAGGDGSYTAPTDDAG